MLSQSRKTTTERNTKFAHMGNPFLPFLSCGRNRLGVSAGAFFCRIFCPGEADSRRKNLRAQTFREDQLRRGIPDRLKRANRDAESVKFGKWHDRRLFREEKEETTLPTKGGTTIHVGICDGKCTVHGMSSHDLHHTWKGAEGLGHLFKKRKSPLNPRLAEQFLLRATTANGRCGRSGMPKIISVPGISQLAPVMVWSNPLDQLGILNMLKKRGRGRSAA